MPIERVLQEKARGRQTVMVLPDSNIFYGHVYTV